MAYASPRQSKYSYRVGQSSAGLGLFAMQPMKRGDFVTEYFGPLLSNEEADENGGKYLFEISKKWVINGVSRKNLARYLNHSCKPNCYAEIDGKRVFIYTRRKIEPREELTYRYGKEYFDDIIKPNGCMCDSCKNK